MSAIFYCSHQLIDIFAFKSLAVGRTLRYQRDYPLGHHACFTSASCDRMAKVWRECACCRWKVSLRRKNCRGKGGKMSCLQVQYIMIYYFPSLDDVGFLKERRRKGRKGRKGTRKNELLMRICLLAGESVVAMIRARKINGRSDV